MSASGGDGVITKIVLAARKCGQVTASCYDASFRLSAIATFTLYAWI